MEVRGELQWIELHTNDGWTLSVDARGGGSMWYGPQARSRADFPANTFDFQQMRTKLTACKEGYQAGAAAVVRIYSTDHALILHRCTHDSLLARRWLHLAYEALSGRAEPTVAHQQLHRAWRNYPPLWLGVEE